MGRRSELDPNTVAIPSDLSLGSSIFKIYSIFKYVYIYGSVSRWVSKPVRCR